MNPLVTIRTYSSHARTLSRFWGRPFTTTLAKMVAGRLLYGRGPKEFDEYRFTTKPVGEWRQYLDERERKSLQGRAAPREFRYLEEVKLQFWKRCLETGLPTVPITAVVAPGPDMPLVEGVAVARTPAELAGIMAPLGDFDGFAKPLAGGQGYGAFTFTLRSGRVTAAEVIGSSEDLFTYCTTVPFGNNGYLLQPRMVCHPGLKGVMPGPGLGTVRLTTFLDPQGTVTKPWAVLKIPGPGQVVCNPRLGALMLEVDLPTGRLGPAVGPTPDVPVVHVVETHPTTGLRFSEATVPLWPEIVELVTRAAHAFSELPCLGWDVAVLPDGPVLLETNWAFGIYTQQIVLNRGLRDEFRAHYARCTR